MSKPKRRSTARAAEERTRLNTGIAGFDEILRGGLIPRRFYIVEGDPGTGKTIFASQLAFNRARVGERCVYVTMLAETNAALLENLESLAFFDSSFVTTRITYVNGYQALADGGLRGLSALVGTMIEKHRAQLLVLDGIAGWPELTESPIEIRHFMREVAISCSLLGCTALATMPNKGPGRDWIVHAESVADGLFLLSRMTRGLRAVRTLEVLKLRGSAMLEGAHAFDISSDGIVVHPRLEARLAGQPAAAEHKGRCAFGLKELDAMLCGGLPRASTTVLAGAAGAGKTVLGMHFLVEGARRRENGLYFGFYESPERLVAKARGVGIGLDTYLRRHVINLMWQEPLESSIDALAEKTFEAIERGRVSRVFIDGIDAFAIAAAFNERLSRFLVAFTNELRRRGVTSLFTQELALLGAPEPRGTESVSAIFENMLLLRFVELRSHLHRLLSIVKLRESDFDTAIREFQITSRGIQLSSTFASSEAVLSGYARHAGYLAETSAAWFGAPRRGRR